MTLTLTENQRKRIEKDLVEAKIKMVQARSKLGKTLEIAITESGWDEWLEEDAERVQYYKNRIAKLTEILNKGEIEVNG
jgi:hypothetical protein